jgi:biopolymer transport protein TolQ
MPPTLPSAMLAPLFSPPLLGLLNIMQVFLQSDPVGQAIVVGLAIFSLIAWTIMFGKHYELKRLGELNYAFEARLRDERSLLDLPESYRNRRSIPVRRSFCRRH